MSFLSIVHISSHTDLDGSILHTREEHVVASLGHAQHTAGVRKCGEDAALPRSEMYCDLLFVWRKRSRTETVY